MSATFQSVQLTFPELVRHFLEISQKGRTLVVLEAPGQYYSEKIYLC